ncbi:MAG TPA: hypothetical protein GXZ85_07360 [Firmicutes bacterium]|jgi:hypothetical protein|nr:hypothetical protein [Bacillota bacterium]
MHKTTPDLETLLAEIERLRLENAILRRAAGIQVSPAPNSQQPQVTHDERQALLRKTV